MKMDCSATCWPGQMRRPKPKGKSKSMRGGCVGLMKRSGSNLSGSGNTSGSFDIALESNKYVSKVKSIPYRACELLYNLYSLDICVDSGALRYVITLVIVILGNGVHDSGRRDGSPPFTLPATSKLKSIRSVLEGGRENMDILPHRFLDHCAEVWQSRFVLERR